MVSIDIPWDLSLIHIFTDNWESRLESQFLKNNRCCKKVYICSPLSAETDEEKFLDKLNVLIKASFENGNRIKELTEEVCDTYTITDN